MKNLIKYFKQKWAIYYFKQKKKEALRLNQATGKRFYVVPGKKGKLNIITREVMKEYNKNKPKNQRINIDSLLRLAVYVTPVN